MNAGGRRQGKRLFTAAAFLAACNAGKRHILISRDYVVIPRAMWEDISRGTTRHRIVSIDEAAITDQGRSDQ